MCVCVSVFSSPTEQERTLLAIVGWYLVGPSIKLKAFYSCMSLHKFSSVKYDEFAKRLRLKLPSSQKKHTFRTKSAYNVRRV